MASSASAALIESASAAENGSASANEDGSATVARWLENVKQSTSRYLDAPNDSISAEQLFFTVPLSLRSDVNADPYKPILFNFGLWHGDACFDGFRSSSSASASFALLFKLQAAKEFCRLGKSGNLFEDLVKKLMEFDEKLRKCYEHCAIAGLSEAEMSREAAAYAMALDVVTVYIAARANEKDIGFHPRCVRSMVRSDAILVNNQLPIFAFRCVEEIVLRDEKIESGGTEEEIFGKKKLAELYAYRDSPFSYGWAYTDPNSDVESLLGCIYDGWMGPKISRAVDIPADLPSFPSTQDPETSVASAAHGSFTLPNFDAGNDERRQKAVNRSRRQSPTQSSSSSSSYFSEIVVEEISTAHESFATAAAATASSEAHVSAAAGSQISTAEEISSVIIAPPPPQFRSPDSQQLSNCSAAVDDGDHFTDLDLYFSRPLTYGDLFPRSPDRAAAAVSFPNRDRNSRSACLMSASNLHRSGIRFKAVKNLPADCSWNLATCIQFDQSSGTLTLPKITVVHGTRRFLLNLLAYEHTSRFWKPCTLLSYVCIMDMLINNEEDVEVLVKCGAVDNALGSHAQMAAMWNGLTEGYPFRLSSAHKKLVQSVNKESRRRWRRWRYGFLETYYERRPWLLVSAVAAFILLALTVVQTIFAVIKR